MLPYTTELSYKRANIDIRYNIADTSLEAAKSREDKRIFY